MKQKMIKKQALAKRADLKDWAFGYRCQCAVKTKLREGLYLQTRITVY